MAKAVEKGNPYCCFAFKYHWLKKHPSRKISNVLFRAQGVCTFNNCNMECQISIQAYDHSNPPSTLDVSLSFSSIHVSHGLGERRARPIKGPDRDELKSKLKNQKPSAVRHQQLLGLSSEAFLSGKRDSVGVSPTVLQKIRSEHLKSQYLHEDLCTALLMLRERQIGEDKSKVCAESVKSVLPGYIQRVSSFPFHVICFTETGLKIWHNIASQSTVFCDATGSLSSIRAKPLPTGSSRVLLYYSLVVKHPVAKCPPVAVAEFLSTEHTALAVSHFLEVFRRAEGLLYTKLVKPKVVVIDRSPVLLNSFLKVFNSESLSEYLHRCFRIVFGCNDSEQDLKKIFVLACVSHVMKNAKEQLRKLL